MKKILHGKTTVLAGPSGVGKSSLINLLQSEVMMETGSISRKIDRGKHTTRHSELLVLEEDEKVEDCGSYIVDTPGFSSLYVNDFEKEQLKYYFPEFGPYEGLCRFSGCDHVHEPDCAVKQAAEEGKIHEIRYNDYVAMYVNYRKKGDIEDGNILAPSILSADFKILGEQIEQTEKAGANIYILM